MLREWKELKKQTGGPREGTRLLKLFRVIEIVT